MLKAEPALQVDAAIAPQKIDLEGRRLVVLLFDLSSMQPEEIERAVGSARTYVETQMAAADLVAIASVSSTLQVDQDFTGDKTLLTRAFDRYVGIESEGFMEGATPEAEATETEAFVPDDSEFNIFNTDRRLQAIETLAGALAPIQQKKSIIYFSSGVTRSGTDNQVQLRSATDRAVKANVSIYPVDARGLQALVPGGDATQRARPARPPSPAARCSGNSIARRPARTPSPRSRAIPAVAPFSTRNDFSESTIRARRRYVRVLRAGIHEQQSRPGRPFPSHPRAGEPS